ncbi:hypothetical protein BCR36DRAFT_408528 [Piromyces finnis]|uniref:Uncharacterized protein n=1 Tax=Piromyces finnis TaxID=1754191 RepID=A0A1Y1VN24_9FUNG|nr:hypothetical protein BCR36DRAFT_408528 [Piromyces finnis]|eukprot:ORX60169.1 hypothetical protein BCR36DRAFT_408528 [Piromyces finnis]
MNSLNKINNICSSNEQLCLINKHNPKEQIPLIVRKTKIEEIPILKHPTSNLKSISYIKKNLPLRMVKSNESIEVRAFEIFTKLRHIKGLENLDEKSFLDTINICNEVKSQSKKMTNNTLMKTKDIKSRKTMPTNIKNNKKNINYNNVNNNDKVKINESNVSNLKMASDIENGEKIISSKLMEFILNLFSTLFWKLNVKSFQNLKEDRKNEKKIDLQHNVLVSEKRDHEMAFQMVFKSLVKKELKNQGYLCKKDFDIFNKNDCLDALDFLVSLLNPSPKSVIDNIFDTQNKNIIDKKASIGPLKNKQIEEKKKISVNNFNNYGEENIIYDEINNFYKITNEKDSPKIKKDNNFIDILPLTSIPTKRMEKYKNYNNEDLANINDNEIIKKLKNEMKILKSENIKLINENKKIKLLLKDITSENGKQETNIKRLAILKSQIIQLKRQVVSQEKIINEKASYIDDIENITNNLSMNINNIEKCNTLNENTKYELKHLKILLTRLNEKLNNFKSLNYLEKNTSSIFSNIDDNNNKNEFIFYSDFISSTTRPRSKISILDICSGNTDHLNIKHIGRLETKLHQLYIDLTSINIFFDSFFSPKLDIVLKNEAKKKYEIAISSLNDTINYLLPLSVLIPSAPYPDLNKVLKPGMPLIPASDDIVKALSLPNNIDKKEIKNKLDNIIKGFKIYQDIITKEKDSYINIFSEYKTNFKNICQSVKNEIINYEEKYKAIGNVIINIKYPLNNIYKSLRSLKDNFNTDNLIDYLKLTEKELTKVLFSLNNLYK